MKNYLIIVEDYGPSYFDARNPSVIVLTMNLTCNEDALSYILAYLKEKYTHPMIIHASETRTVSTPI
jgi:hypothetical protein